MTPADREALWFSIMAIVYAPFWTAMFMPVAFTVLCSVIVAVCVVLCRAVSGPKKRFLIVCGGFTGLWVGSLALIYLFASR